MIFFNTIKEASALGAAIITGVGVGAFTRYAEAVVAGVKFERASDPDIAMQDRYQARYPSI